MAHQTFWKPEKVVKEKKQWRSGTKSKKEVPEWKKSILSHHNSSPSRADRADFPRNVIEELIAESNGLCQCCGRLPAETTHHVRPRGRSGRGVKTNGMRLNWVCHDRIQTNEEELQYWMSEWERKYGANFYFDEQDWEEHYLKQTAANAAEQDKQQRVKRIEPIVDLLSAAAGRTLIAKEMRLLDGMDDKEMVIFAKLMQDVVGAALAVEKPLGYGHFND
ncbi:HNH endonuclease [Paenibacillus radicis (ex Xue et al. 2023)]|uniref:HNH endonuclease n=1 Tax=Paenibacillus radicis (ex Xue et al. 2023) TaxID=2972489 RepID=A0ABT1YN96_9BACL|nr:HNH endonuclease [Paenibacillus radicis (ex Xue et al. 2023)]MCR8633465.1 HNH endonuclease [Paenibacillus radicis (ex Xue et al. 2023)]